MAIQTINSDNCIYYEPLERTLMTFNEAYAVLTKAATYAADLAKKNSRNDHANVAAGVEKARSPEPTWREEEEWPDVVDVAKPDSGDYTSSATTITLASGQAKTLVPKMELQVASTGEQVTIVSKSGDTITIQRAPADAAHGLLPGAVAAGAIGKNDKLILLGTALYDADDASEMRSAATCNEFKNYIQTFDVTSKLTEGTDCFEFHGGPIRIRVDKKIAREASRRLETAMVLGRPSKKYDPSDATNIRYTMLGLGPAVKYYSPNCYDLGGSAATFDTIMGFESCFRSDGTGDVIYLCSQDGLGIFDKMALNNVRVTPADVKWGYNVKEVSGILRKIKLVHLPALDTPGCNIGIIRFNPLKDMKILKAMPWSYKECGKDEAKTYTEHWLHGKFSAKFSLLEQTSGMLYNFASPYTRPTNA